MTEDKPNPEMEKRWQDYLKRRRRGKYLIYFGMVVIVISLFIGYLPVTVAAFTGTVYISTPWSDYFGVGIIFGLVLIVAGLIDRISPNMIDGDALWVMKLGPFGKGR